MSALATTIVAWAAVYGYMGIYYTVLFGLRRRGAEYLWFGLMNGACAVYAIGGAVLTEATTVSMGRVGAVIHLSALPVAAACFVAFAYALMGRRSRIPWVTGGWAAITTIAVLAGLCHGQNLLPRAPLTLATTHSYLQPALTPLALPLLGIGFALAAASLANLGLRLWVKPELRWMALAAGINVVASAHDLLIRFGAIRSVFLVEHTALLPGAAMSYLLLHRFLITGDELRRRTSALTESYRKLKTSQARLVSREQMAAVGELSAVIAHEVRNPLAVIRNALSSLRKESVREADRETLHAIVAEESARLRRLARDLLAYAGPATVATDTVSIEGVLRDAIEGARQAQSASPKIETRLTLGASRHDLRGDGALLRQAFLNILENAAQAMPSGGTLDIATQDGLLDGNPSLRVRFEDTGGGMTDEQLQKARDPFYTTRSTGTGLGLAIVNRITQLHGGKLELQGGAAGGTVVMLTLPRRSSTDQRGQLNPRTSRHG